MRTETPPERKSILDFIDVSPAACTARHELNAARELCGATIDNPAEFAVAQALLREALANLDRFYLAKRTHRAP